MRLRDWGRVAGWALLPPAARPPRRPARQRRGVPRPAGLAARRAGHRRQGRNIPLPCHEYSAASAAAAALDGEVRAAEFRREYSRRTRRDVTARDAYDHARARQAADEEARGAGVSLLGLYVTVTVTDPAQLPRATADTEASAESSKIRLQRLYRSQAAGFTATLPCGICLPDLAHRIRH